MASAYFLEFCALAFALTGLAAVIWEIAVKDKRLFGEILTDVRAMAEPRQMPTVNRFATEMPVLGECANSNGLKKAA
jgi:hypothetical protein